MYALGPVKPHVKRAAEYFGPRHGYSVIYGWRAVGSVPNSYHPKGQALDFMSSNKVKGDGLVAELISSAATWNVLEIIWYRRIWIRGHGWSAYNGTPNPHIDHVHVSFGASAQVPDTMPAQNPLVPDWVEGLQANLKALDTGISWVTNANNWKRLSMFFVGTVLLLIALGTIPGAREAAKTITKGAKKVSGYAKP